MSKTIKGQTGDWEIVVGMEVHAQILSNAKLFSGAATAFGAEPNSQVSFIDAGMPGMLPVINRKCVEQAVRTGLGLKAQINLHSVFDRKNYFYPDLPQGYQISQYKSPIVGEGEILLDMKDETIKVGIERLHMEQDAGKSLHDQHPDASFVDLNRSGVALMEIVSKPHMRSSEEAAAFLRKLRSILRYLGTCDGNMDEGSMRADVNVSVCRAGGYEKFRATGDFRHLGTRCEIKNVNSMRFVQMAVEYEARRQVDILEDGGTIVQETRLYDSKANETRSMRSKEEAHDYRYFPDPDLLPLVLDQAWVDDIARSLPELPDEKKARLVKAGLSAYDATVLVAEKESADYFEAMLATGIEAKAAANWLNNEYFGRLNKAGLAITDGPVSAQANAAIVKMVADNTISGKIAKDLLDIVWSEGGDPVAVVEARGMKQVTDTSAIEKAVDAVIAANPQKVEEVKAKPKMASWFTGQVMKATGGKANPGVVNAILKQRLGLPED
ncbi:MAG: Asp-tRNA(Asn)/Glu-tRNA(Gln) amidotransferase subunit GatB [Alphaproteobacteria bacterium]|nr:Asp-tRNA(Asn)/Glu-tRNA(Gln) amidotransferase subunit GatB [Alphaproteobacteria bacterium]MBL7099392.1 Asp-tRNA(Asn)/Glu-tRNA(Gln) amidotransferase subunit GatB [Alphaproteobacteria bacterium]